MAGNVNGLLQGNIKTIAMLQTKAREVFVLIKNSLQQLILSPKAAIKFSYPSLCF
jgi:hypothetical protein